MDPEEQEILDDHEEANGNLVEEMLLAIAAWLILVGQKTREEIRQFVYDTFPGVVERFQTAAVQEAYQFYLRMRMHYGFTGPMNPPSEEDITRARNESTRTGVVVSQILKNSYDQPVTSSGVLDAVHKIASNVVLDVDKHVQVLMSNADSVKTATFWHTESGACPWCAERDGIRTNKIVSHDNCRCTLRTVFYV